MQANYVQRLRIVFGKEGPTRYIGHLDLARTLERALNRAKIPFAYSQGFNRRPRMQLASPLPLGITSECEIVDIWLVERLIPEKAKRQMIDTMAPGILIHEVREVDLKAPALQTVVIEASYDVVVNERVEEETLLQRIDTLLSSEQIIRERRGKRYDLRPAIIELRSLGSNGDNVRLAMRLSLLPGRSGRPDEVLYALELDPLGSHIHRKALTLSDSVPG